MDIAVFIAVLTAARRPCGLERRDQGRAARRW